MDQLIWHQLAGRAVGINCASRKMMVHRNSSSKMFLWSEAKEDWDALPGEGISCDIGVDGELWSVSPQNVVQRYDAKTSNWLKVDGAEGPVTSVSVGSKDHVVVANKGGNIFRLGAGNTWSKIDGASKVTSVSIGSDGDLWMVNSDGAIYRLEGGSWSKMEGTGKYVSVGNRANILHRNADKEVFRYTADIKAQWKRVATKCAYATIGSDGAAACIDDDSNMFIHNPEPLFGKSVKEYAESNKRLYSRSAIPVKNDIEAAWGIVGPWAMTWADTKTTKVTVAAKTRTVVGPVGTVASATLTECEVDRSDSDRCYTWMTTKHPFAFRQAFCKLGVYKGETGTVVAMEFSGVPRKPTDAATAQQQLDAYVTGTIAALKPKLVL